MNSALARFVRSTIGLKIVMAVSGLLLAGFVVQHMTGHLQVMAGNPDQYNAYAAFLQGLGLLKWAVRFGLIGLLAVHIMSGLELKKRNTAARPVDYHNLVAQRSTLYGKTMLISGIVIAVYLVYHLMHFTLGWVHPQYFGLSDAMGRHDVYRNFVESFRNPVITVVYVAGSLFVAAHLAHALGSMFRTLGLSSGRFRPFFDRLGPAIALVTAVGFILPPLSILLGR